MKPETTEAYRCACCGRTYLDRDVAERCCVCETCGREGTHNGLVECVDCQHEKTERRRDRWWSDARKVAVGDYDGDMVYVEAIESYVTCDEQAVLEEAAQYFEEDPETFSMSFREMRVFGVEVVPIAINPESASLDLYDIAYEGWQLDPRAYADLERLCREWNDRWAENAYYPDYKTAITEDAHDAMDAAGIDQYGEPSD